MMNLSNFARPRLLVRAQFFISSLMRNILISQPIKHKLQLQDPVIYMNLNVATSKVLWTKEDKFSVPLKPNTQCAKLQQDNINQCYCLLRQRTQGSLEVIHLEILKLHLAIIARSSILVVENVLRSNSDTKEGFLILLFSTAFSSYLWDIFPFPECLLPHPKTALEILFCKDHSKLVSQSYKFGVLMV